MELWLQSVTCIIGHGTTVQDGVMLASTSLIMGIRLELNGNSFELIPMCLSNKNNRIYYNLMPHWALASRLGHHGPDSHYRYHYVP